MDGIWVKSTIGIDTFKKRKRDSKRSRKGNFNTKNKNASTPKCTRYIANWGLTE